MTVFHEARHAGEFILTEASGKRSRENVTIAAQQVVTAGAILALLAHADDVSVSAVAADGNTGDAELALAEPAISGKAKHGTYTVIFTGATAYKVEDPTGKEIGTGATDAAFNKEVKFTIPAGSPAFAAGDRFSITVAVETADYQAVAYDPDGSDGSEKPGAIAIYPASTGESETTRIAALVRDCEVNGNILGWPEGITPEQQEHAIGILRGLGIIVR